MAYDSILVHMEYDKTPNGRLQYATDLAGELDAYLIGFAAIAVRPVHVSEMGVSTDDAWNENIGAKHRQRFRKLKREFLSIAGDGRNSGWRQSEDLPTRALLTNARAADLIISGTPHGAFPGDIYGTVDPGDLACGAGRPVLFVGEGADFHHPQCAMIGWKDTPEARRAVVFALPFLKLSKHTLVVAISEDGREDPETGIYDVARYLTRHGIDCDAMSVTAKGGADSFIEVAHEENAELVVTGAYGHSRMREHIFGGFTRALLMQRGLTRLMAG
jgi:nucleotide-binding universal stress UspA family protein